MAFMDKFGTGQGWLSKTFGNQSQQTPSPVDSTMDMNTKTNSAFTQPQPKQKFTPNLGQQTTPVEQNTMTTQPSDYDTMINQFGQHWGQDKAGLENV